MVHLGGQFSAGGRGGRNIYLQKLKLIFRSCSQTNHEIFLKYEKENMRLQQNVNKYK